MIAWLTRFPIRTRTVLLVVIGLAITLAVLGTLSTQALRVSTQNALDERLSLAQVAAQHIDDHVVKDVLAGLERAAASEGFDLTDADPEPERRALRELFAAGLFAHDVFITDRQGRVLEMEPPTPAMIGVDFSTQPEVRQALQTGEPQVSGLVRFHQAEKVKVTFVVPVKDSQGTVVGLIGGAADPTSPSIAGILSALRPAGGHVDLVDQDGMVLSSTDPQWLFKKGDHASRFAELIAGRQAVVRGCHSCHETESRFQRQKEIMAFAPLPVTPWGVAIRQPEAEALAPVYVLRQQWFLAGAAVLLVTFLLTWITTQAVLDPLSKLLAAAHRIAAGDLETPVLVLGRDEIGDLGRSFEEMRQQLGQHQKVLAAWGEQLERKVAERTRELSALYAIDRAAAQSLDLDEILDDSLDTVLEVLKVEAGGILLLEPDGETMTLQVHRGVSEEFVAAVKRIRLGEGISGRAAAEEKPVVLDVPDYPTERLAPVVVEEGFQTLASTPLVAKGRALGALTLGTRRPRAFPPEERDLLAAVGQQLGGAVENARLYEREHRLVTYLRHLNQATTRANANLQLDTLTQVVVESLVEKFGAAFARLWVVDEAGEHLVLRASAGLYTRLDGSRARVSIATDPHKLGVIAREREPLITNTVQQDPHFDRTWAEQEGLVSFAGYPVVLGDELLGLLALFSRQPLDEEMLDVLGAFVNQVAIALQNAGLFEELEHRVHELEALFEMGRAVTASLRVEDVLDLVVEVAPRTLRAEGCYLFLWDEHEEHLVLRAVEGFLEEHVGRMTYRLGEGLAGWVFLEGKPANVPDMAADPRWKRDPEHEATLPSGQANSALVVPLIVRDKTLGVLGVVNKENGEWRMEDGEGKMENGRGKMENGRGKMENGRGTTEEGSGNRGIQPPISNLQSPISNFPSPSSVFTPADESLLTALAGQVAVAIENARLYEDIRDLSLGAIRSLAAAIDARDPYTRGHSEEVTDLAVRLAREMGWEGTDLEMLEFAALLHDVGKIAVPDAILRKTEPLTLEDWDVIKLHPYHSAQIVKPVKALQRIVPWVYHHQEWWDGTGYPDGLKREEIPLASRIIAVADAYNAMTTERPYRPALSHAEAVEELQECAGTQFDPQVVKVFLRMLEEKGS